MKGYEEQLVPGLNGKLWLLAALFMVVLPHLLRMPLLLSLLCVAVFGWRLGHELRGWSLPRRLQRWMITLVGFTAVAVLYKSVIGRDAGIALLSVMLCLKLLELRTLRDAMVTLYLGYFLVIGGFLFSQSIFNGVYLMVVVVLLTAALIALNHPQSSLTNTRYYLRYSGQLLLQAFPLMLVMFVLFPRLNGPLWQMPEESHAARTGLSDELSLGSITNLAESEEVAFRVNFSGEMPSAGQLYWRGPVLWNTDGRQWRRARMRMATELPHYQALSEPFSYSVTMEPSNKSWLFALDLPQSLPQGLENPVFIRPDFQLLAWQPITQQTRYTISSVSNYRWQELSPAQRRMALQLPEDINPQTLQLARQWRQSSDGDATILNQARAFFSEQPFYYTRQPPLLQGDHPVDQFLFQTRRGFCEHYASSFVTLMRAAGIPARVVLGYQGGERNNFGNYLIVRQSNAHSWAEVWLPQLGWTRIDPTALIPDERIESDSDSQRFTTTDLLPASAGSGNISNFGKLYWKLRHSWDAVNHTWNQWVLGFDREQQEKLLRAIGMKEVNWQNMITMLVGLMGFLLASITLIILIRRPRQRDPVQRLYQLFCNKLASRGTVRAVHEGPRDFSRRACAEQPHWCEQINTITTLYISLRYRTQAQALTLSELKRAIKKL